MSRSRSFRVWLCYAVAMGIGWGLDTLPVVRGAEQPAAAQAPHGINGIIVPRDLDARAVRQNKAAAPAFARVAARSPKAAAPPRKLNWFSKDPTQHVISQGRCGSCWACAGVQTYLVSRGRQLGDWDCDPSAQHVLDCAGSIGSCGGGWVPFDLFVSPGVQDAKDRPYVGYEQRCRTNPGGQNKGLAWKYLDEDGQIPDDETVIDAVNRYGAVWACIRADGALSNYEAGEVWRSPRGSINHAVTIVGYDLDEQVWIVLNSWGSGWGDKGTFKCKMGSNIGLGAAVILCQPDWMGEPERASLAKLASPPDKKPGCCDGLKLDGPSSVSCGELVALTAPAVSDSRVSWLIPQSRLGWKVDTSRRTLYLAAGCEPCEVLIVCALSKADADPELIEHRLTIGEPEPAPTPEPGPGPRPKPEPAELNSFGEKVSGWAAALLPSAERAARALAVADNFAAVGAELRDGKLTSLPDAMADVAARNAKTLAVRQAAWQPFFDALSKRWGEAIQADELVDAEQMAMASFQVALGLRAAVKAQAEIVADPEAKPTPPAAAEAEETRRINPQPTGRWLFRRNA